MSYSVTQAILAVGTTIGYSSTIGGTYTNFSEPTKLALPKQVVAAVKATNMNSPNKTHEKIIGFNDPGVVDVAANYIRADYVWLMSNKGVAMFFKITLPDGTSTGTTIAGPGFVSEVDGDAPAPDEKLMGGYKITYTGAVTVTAGTP